MSLGRIVLFDVDGTLLNGAGAGRRSMARTFEQLCGRVDAAEFPYDGLTDRAIARRGLERAGRVADEAAIDAIVERYLRHLPEELAASRGFRVLPGAAAAIDAAHAGGGAIGLGTGNVERGAALKLARAGLHARLSFGGFGDDGEAREALIAAGIVRGAARLGRAVQACRVLVVGDTPLDVAAARACGAACLAVATGRSDAATLAAAGAHFVAESLEAPAALALLRDGRGAW